MMAVASALPADPAGAEPVPTGRYDLLASALAGRGMAVRPGLDGFGLAYVAGRSIVVPRTGFADDLDAMLCVAAQALLVAGGSLAPFLLRKLLGRTLVARRYAWLEVLRAVRSAAAPIPAGLEHHPLVMGAPIAPPADARESLAVAFSQRRIGPVPLFAGTVRPLAALRELASAEGLASLFDGASASPEQAAEQPARTDSEEETAQTSRILQLLQNPLAGRNPLADLLNSLTGAARSSLAGAQGTGGDAGRDASIDASARAGWRGVRATRARSAGLPQPRSEAEGGATHRYPEWDVRTGTLRPDRVWLTEVDAWNAEGGTGRGGFVPALPRAFVASLAGIGLSYEMRRGQKDGSDLDSGRLSDLAIDLRLGQAPENPAIFRASRRTRRDLGVVVLLDLSASTEEASVSGRSVFGQQMQAACHLTEAFDRLGCAVALQGFHSWGRHAVHAVRLKGHEEAWSSLVTLRCGMVEPLGYTRLGAAIRHAEMVLRRRIRLPSRLMVLISDGFAFDLDYEGAYAQADTRAALAQARANGIAVVCLCIGGSTEDGAVSASFGAADTLRVETAAQIAPRLAALCAQALASAARRSPWRPTPG